MDFESFVKDIEKNSLNVYGVEVYEDGLLTNAYGDTDISFGSTVTDSV